MLASMISTQLHLAAVWQTFERVGRTLSRANGPSSYQPSGNALGTHAPINPQALKGVSFPRLRQTTAPVCPPTSSLTP
jgi:hypothetical protein